MLNFLKKEKVITRIAPSPTGVLHVGTARTALFNYLFAKQNKGKFILRIEDTDKERSTKEFEKDIVDMLNWLGLKKDSFFRQSERSHIYKKYLKKLLDSNKAYISKETGGERSEVIRFKNTNRIIVFDDQIRGKIKFDTTELGDFVIAKSLDEPLYHLAVVVDDFKMGVTHVIRGEDGISNTPRQILIQEAIGAKTPVYVHLPLLLGKDKSKLSKRHGAVSLEQYKKDGYLVEALVNYLAMLGWNPGEDKEIFSMKELIKEFDLKKVSKSGAIFNIEKLDWFNKEHLKLLPSETVSLELMKRFKKFNPDKKTIERIKPTILERISKWSDIDEIIKLREMDFVFNTPNYSPRNLSWKKVDIKITIEHLKKIIEIISAINKEFPKPEEVKIAIWDYANEQGRGDVLWPIRYALSGLDRSPDPFELVAILGKTESVKRITTAIKKLYDM